jgi:hypothetical protein
VEVPGAQENDFLRLRLPNKGVFAMHRDHDVFVRSIERETKVKLTFVSKKHYKDMIGLCAPLHFSKSITGQDEQDCYYFWNFGAKKGNNFLSLSSSEIIGIELTDEAFSTQDFHNFSKPAKK